MFFSILGEICYGEMVVWFDLPLRLNALTSNQIRVFPQYDANLLNYSSNLLLSNGVSLTNSHRYSMFVVNESRHGCVGLLCSICAISAYASDNIHHHLPQYVTTGKLGILECSLTNRREYLSQTWIMKRAALFNP
jgi:hypothetical protein